MRDRAGFLAGLADTLTDMCVYYVLAGVLILSRDVWGVHLFWFLLWSAVCAVFYWLLLGKPRSVPLLTAATGVLGLMGLGLFWLASETQMRFGYGFVLAVGAGMAVGLPLYNALHRPLIHRHLTRLDVLILALAGLLLTREALGIDGGVVALMTVVLLLDAAAAVGLRMSDGAGEDGGNALRACLIALGAAAGLALVIALMTALFSRSGGVTGGLLHGIGAFFSSLWRGIERFFGWLVSLFPAPEEELVPVDAGAVPSVAELGSAGESGSVSVNGTALGAASAVLVLAGAALLAVRLRKKRVARGTGGAVSASYSSVRRTGGTAAALWRRLRERLRFAWTAFVHRDTPGGVLLLAEKRARRARVPRRPGETMRQFLDRADPSGGLNALADALEREYYGGESPGLDTAKCRALRRYVRKRQPIAPAGGAGA